MKKIIYLLMILVFTTTSCIEWGLDELPAYEEVEITDFDLEHRYTAENANGVESVVFTRLSSSVDISTDDATITVTASIPPPTTVFTQEIRRSISLESIAGYVKISPAAKIEPLDGSPTMGVPGDFSVASKFKVTAADGITSKDWTIIVNPLPIINQYEGAYLSTGNVTHPAPAYWEWVDLEKYYSSIDANTIEGSLADNWPGGGSWKMKISINADNSISIAHSGDSSDTLELIPGDPNNYNPTTKTITLNYRYSGSGGYRILREVLVLK